MCARVSCANADDSYVYMFMCMEVVSIERITHLHVCVRVYMCLGVCFCMSVHVCACMCRAISIVWVRAEEEETQRSEVAVCVPQIQIAHFRGSRERKEGINTYANVCVLCVRLYFV